MKSRQPSVAVACVALGLGLGLVIGVSAFFLGAAEPRPSHTNSVSTSTNADQSAKVVEVPITTMRGRIVCLPEEMHRQYGIDPPAQHAHLWSLQASNGLFYTILPGRQAEAIFQDERVRAKTLELRVRVLPKTQAIDIQALHSVRNGVVQDLYYFCDICAIQSVSPEICACCQGPVELIEKPIETMRP
jgi:hypothetical protein